MKLPAILKKKATERGENSLLESDMSVNDATDKRQRMVLGIGGGFAVLIAGYYIFSAGDGGIDESLANGERTIETKDLINGPGSEQEWIAASEARFRSLENAQASGEAAQRRVGTLEQELERAREQRGAMANDGQRVITAYQEENDRLREALQTARSNPVARVGPSSTPLPSEAQTRVTPVGGVSDRALGRSALREVNLMSFDGDGPASGSRITDNTTSFSNNPNYLPPNSIASAKVIVGVNASAGVNSQTDPLPVVLRITGPARSVFNNGRLLQTNVQGCLVNGAARGDLSSERIYVKLQRMTCPQSNGRVAVSQVKGFIAFGGTTGVRGRVVSREGSLATQAFLAGLIGGFGEGLSSTANPILGGGAVIADGDSEGASTSDILRSGFGSAARQTGESVSDYLIERAEQYQPVVEMPVGIDVEVVFLEGVFIES